MEYNCFTTLHFCNYCWGFYIPNTARTAKAVQGGPGMYPKSTFITDVSWNIQKYILDCGDNAATTLSANDFLYGSIGDCHTSFNLLEIKGSPPSLTSALLNPKVDGKTWPCCGYDGGKQKSASMLAIGTTIYSLQRNWDGRTGVGLVVSTDNGRTFTSTNPLIKINVGYPNFINAGKGYLDAPDNYIYIWGHGCENSAYSACDKMIMLRVPTSKITDNTAYAYFAGMNGSSATWIPTDPNASDLLQKAASVFDCAGTGKCNRAGMTYNKPLQRYIAWMSDWNGTDDFRNPGVGGFGIYESQTPWDKSSWKMAWHTPTNNGGWGIFTDDGIGDGGVFTTKWMSIDGKQMYLAYGGTNLYSLRQATFITAGVTPAPTSGTCPKKSSGDADCNNTINLADFELFRREFTNIVTTKLADFNNNGKVELADFELWRVGFFSPVFSVTPTGKTQPIVTTPATPTVTGVPLVSPTVSKTPTPTQTLTPTRTPTPTMAISPSPIANSQFQTTMQFAAQQLNVDVTTFGSTSYPTYTNSSGSWSNSGSSSWTSGFFPGQLWLMYELTGDVNYKNNAIKWQAGIEGQKTNTSTHDVGFMLYTSFGNGFRLTNDPAYKQVLLTTAKSLATRYNPTVGTIKSWNGGSTDHIVIIDNMMNLELLFWGARNGGDPTWKDMAISHALKTSQNHVRADGSTFHVVNYDPTTGAIKRRYTAQGYSDSSTWARGQAWAIYGFSIAYREAQNAQFLTTARKVADYYISHLPSDHIPYWDFQAPNIPNEPRDTSSASIAASGLLELSNLETDATLKVKYKTAAEDILKSLMSSSYLAKGTNNKAILLHGTQNKNNNNYDTGLTFGDYYLLDAIRKNK